MNMEPKTQHNITNIFLIYEISHAPPAPISFDYNCHYNTPPYYNEVK